MDKIHILEYSHSQKIPFLNNTTPNWSNRGKFRNDFIIMVESVVSNSSDKEIISTLAKKIVRHGLAVPAIFFLEMVKYLSFFGSQLMVFFGPVITVFIQSESYYKITHLLEERQNVEFLMLEIERIESDNKKKEL